jgi:catechol 2,3-dioxygenase-like lactoylglutathione lyase family enzyme
VVTQGCGAYEPGQDATMTITHIRVVTVYVTNQQQALEFYRDKLGFEIRADNPMGEQGRWIEAAPPGSRESVIMLADASGFEKTEQVGGFAPCTLECDDARATHAELEGRGVEVTDVETESWGTFFFAHDPDGTRFLVREAASGD